jgi:hypothetical protein
MNSSRLPRARALTDNGSILVRLEDRKYHEAVITDYSHLCLTAVS